MDFFHPFSLMLIIVGLVFILAGLALLKFPPKHINSLYGYRTDRSMRSQEAWAFAQTYSGKELVRWGFILELIAVLPVVFWPDSLFNMVIGIIVLLAVVALIIYRTERALKKHMSQ